MNRGTALLLVMAALLAHALALHQNGAGEFATAHESAHVAFRIARNWVQAGELAWGHETLADGTTRWIGGLESHASPLLVLIAATAERLYLPVTAFCQIAGVIATLLTVALSASFATDRIAGIIPALLLVASGGIAAAAASGTEIPLVTLGMAASFVAFEHRWRRRFSIALVWLALARLDGALIVLAYAVLTVAERRVPRRDGSRPMSAWTFAPALAALLALAIARGSDGRSVLGAMLADLATPDAARLAHGWAALRDWVLGTGVPLLALFPIVAALVRRLAGAGLRALAIALLWIAITVLEGGGAPVFALGFVPTLPVLFVAVQHGIIAALDTHSRWMEAISWAVLLAAASVSALASKFPGNLGPLPLEAAHRRWMQASAEPPYGREGLLGRLALREEIAITAQLRELGGWLQASTPEERTLLTPWPGVLGYLARVRVVDLYERLGGASDGRTPLTYGWTRPVDVLAALAEQPDYVLPGLLSMELVSSRALPEALARELMRADVAPDDPERLRQVRKLLEGYSLLTIPQRREDALRRTGRAHPFFLLQRRDRGGALALDARVTDGRLTIDLAGDALHPGDDLPRLARLRVVAKDERGHEWYLAPNGTLVDDPRTCTRVALMLHGGSARPTRLYEGALAPDVQGRAIAELSVALLNPVTHGGHFLAHLCEEARVPVR